MPSTTTVETFVRQVMSGDHVGAIRDWYTDDAWMQENPGGPRRDGIETLMAHEAQVLARFDSVETELLDPPLVDGDRVAIHWRFTFRRTGRNDMRIEEIAWQTWRGDRICGEIFFYDPAQLGRK
jgi:SnoaL-like domain